jgi:hypothetical protein
MSVRAVIPSVRAVIPSDRAVIPGDRAVIPSGARDLAGERLEPFFGRIPRRLRSSG